ncbi:hypothetical protein TVAG_400870 [Trichomonas vaginalis G3]|uniref:Uncharacterized protein n=1 Tax=Trichomonas vaginalis (strain ATCC PRA-98 / G3) TaxID=412133 RepID=A2E3J5_TRIV3|nr:hypothetical protein TVAGG3_0021250 [Trichomonas vaginalis G3]EAY12761.1 hypothetical protein TVAG_400870 [Trichomonas vaginalis G3]KAI5539681.1 hypothetical protein TVAGG3_0021250 [Trichomonas vaginalis G3]|eukprot:XP_001324984.1 hypothetical protein [Trichomonas vaginalis G3]
MADEDYKNSIEEPNDEKLQAIGPLNQYSELTHDEKVLEVLDFLINPRIQVDISVVQLTYIVLKYQHQIGSYKLIPLEYFEDFRFGSNFLTTLENFENKRLQQQNADQFKERCHLLLKIISILSLDSGFVSQQLLDLNFVKILANDFQEWVPFKQFLQILLHVSKQLISENSDNLGPFLNDIFDSDFKLSFVDILNEYLVKETDYYIIQIWDIFCDIVNQLDTYSNETEEERSLYFDHITAVLQNQNCTCYTAIITIWSSIFELSVISNWEYSSFFH